VVVCTLKTRAQCWILPIFSFEIRQKVNIAGPSKCLHTDKLKERDITEELYCDTDSEEELDGSHISSEDSQENDNTMMNWNGEATFLLIKYMHISLWGNKV
jgi:hypothetical protein